MFCHEFISRCLKDNPACHDDYSLQPTQVMTALTVLNVSWCWKLLELPESLGALSKLQEINLVYCRGLTALPEAFGALSELRELNLSRVADGQKALPKALKLLTGMQAIKFV